VILILKITDYDLVKYRMMFRALADQELEDKSDDI